MWGAPSTPLYCINLASSIRMGVNCSVRHESQLECYLELNFEKSLTLGWPTCGACQRPVVLVGIGFG